METTKYYFEQETQGIQKTDECIFFNRKFLSIECKTCDNCRGCDKEEKWIKCLLYANEFEIYELLKIIQEGNEKRLELTQEKFILQQRVNELEGIISDLQGQEVCNG